MTRLVLASASPGRRKVLRQAGVDPLIVVSGVDEDAVVAGLRPDAAPAEVVCALAAAKADRVAAELDGAVAADCVVLGCDSMLYLDGELCGKPGSADAAAAQWRRMGGRSGRLHTGHCVLRLEGGTLTRRDVESACTTVRFAVPTDADLLAYIAGGEPLDVAGGFHPRRAGRLVRRRHRGRPVERDRREPAAAAVAAGPGGAVGRVAVGRQPREPRDIILCDAPRRVVADVYVSRRANGGSRASSPWR